MTFGLEQNVRPQQCKHPRKLLFQKSLMLLRSYLSPPLSDEYWNGPVKYFTSLTK
jgi:hypothetical protein